MEKPVPELIETRLRRTFDCGHRMAIARNHLIGQLHRLRHSGAVLFRSDYWS